MKLNWINVLASILILGGVVLLIQRKVADNNVKPTPSVSVDDAKALFIKQLEKHLGRPLTDAEKGMVVASKEANGAYKMELQPGLKQTVDAANLAAGMQKTRATVLAQAEGYLGRPLSDVEKEMITVTPKGVTINQVLLSRVNEARAKAAATRPAGTTLPDASFPPVTPAPDMPSTMPTTNPG